MIDLVGLAAKRDTRVLKLSGGQQRRLDVALALAGNPDLLFLDEPTTGFDPSARHEAWEVVKNLAALGKTVLLTTHYMEEAQYLADQVAVISSGRIVAEGPPATIGNRDQARAQIRYRLAGGPAPPADLTAPPGPDGLIELAPDDLTAALHRLTGWALEQHVELNGLEVIRPSLEDVYLQLTGSSAAQAAQASTAPATAAPAAGKDGAGHERRGADAVAGPYTNKAFRRNPASAFFIFAFPLMFLVIFTALLGHGTVRVSPVKVVDTSTYYVAAMASFGVISACYTNIAISVSFQRDTGVLKRTNGTPLPSSAFLGARMLHALLVGILLVVITAGFGRLLYSASIPTGLTLLRFLVMLLVGAASFCALGFAITAVIPNADAAPGDRQRVDPAAAVPVRGLHPAGQQRASVDRVDRPDLPGLALRQGHAGRIPRHRVQLDRRGDRRRLGPGRPAGLGPLLQLGAAHLKQANATENTVLRVSSGPDRRDRSSTIGRLRAPIRVAGLIGLEACLGTSRSLTSPGRRGEPPLDAAHIGRD